jgi:PAS domain S-box-containing protein
MDNGSEENTMPSFEIDQEKARLEEELKIQRQIAFASGLFQGDVTIRTMLESIAEGVVVIDNSGTILLVNTAAEKMFGYARKDLIGKPHAVLIPDRYRQAHKAHEMRYFEAPRSRPMGQLLDLSGRRKDGSEFPLEISLSYIQTINGLLVLAFVSDITPRKQYESRLKEKEELFRIQVECVKDYAVFMLDARGKVLNWNAGAERLYGYREEEIVGRPFSFFYPDEDRLAGKTEELIRKAAGEGRVEDKGWRLREDGSRFWAEVVITALPDEEGNLRGYSKVTHDITERRQAEESLLEAERKLRNIVEHSTNLFYMHTADHVLTYMSPQSRQFFDCEPEEAMVAWTDFITDNPANQVAIEATRRAIDSGQRQPPYEVECIGKTGRKIWVEVNEAPIVENGKAVAVVGSLTDITERKQSMEKIKRLNAELETANRELEAFNYSVAHDLRKPLTVVNGYCQAIRELCGDDLGEQCAGYLREAYQGTLRMNRLIDALLNFARLARVEPERKQVDLSAMAQATAAELQLAEPERRVSCRIAEGIRVDGDANLLQVVLNNLLGNAWKYTAAREEALIEFGEAEVEGRPACFVRDNGAGFSMAEAEKLFVPFERLCGAEEFRGFGIGLATVERIIQRHGGRVWAEGAPDEGATFYFTLVPSEDHP